MHACAAVCLKAIGLPGIRCNHGGRERFAAYLRRLPQPPKRGTTPWQTSWSIEKGIEIAAEDALKWLTGANKALKAAPQVVAALATLIGAVEKPLSELAGAAANPLNIAPDIQAAKDLEAVWPEVKAFLVTLGVKF